MSTDTPAQPIYNPWRESLENCISGDNYLRSSEYHELIGELDELYRLRAASPQPTAAQPPAEPVAYLHHFKRTDGGRRYVEASISGFPRAIDPEARHEWVRVEPLYASAAPTQAVAELVEALRALLDEQDAQQGYATPAAYDRARAALSRAPGAGMPNAEVTGRPARAGPVD